MPPKDLSPTAIVICSTKGNCLPVMAASMNAYLPKDLTVYLSGGDPDLFDGWRVVAFANEGSNFGDSYNAATDRAFADGHKQIWLANDDIVFHPNTWRMFNEDLIAIQEQMPHVKMGVVGTRSDQIMWPQNIRNPGPSPVQKGMQWEVEEEIITSPVIAPILAWVSREAWQVAKFPPTNWYSDNVLCWDLAQRGYMHFVSRAYVHHAGSQTVGVDYQKLHEADWPWVEANRPELARQFGF